MPILPRSDVESGAIETFLGVFQVAATEKGICSLRFPDTEAGAGFVSVRISSQAADKLSPCRNDAADKLSPCGNPDISNRHIGQARDWLLAYLDRRPLPPMPAMDFHWCTDFGRKVYLALMKVPAGNVITYGELARETGHPGSARAVGSWMRKNQIPILIPCHRVVAGGGALGGWSGPDGLKTWLLDHEGGIRQPH